MVSSVLEEEHKNNLGSEGHILNLFKAIHIPWTIR